MVAKLKSGEFHLTPPPVWYFEHLKKHNILNTSRNIIWVLVVLNGLTEVVQLEALQEPA